MMKSRCEKVCGGTGAVVGFILSLWASGCAPHKNANNATSQFAAQTVQEKYEEVAPPAAAPVFRWDFSKAGTAHAYDFEQKVLNKMDLGVGSAGGPGSMGQEMSGKALVVVKSQGDNTAELVLKDMKVSLKMDMGKGGPKTMETEMPPVVVQGMKEDGSGPFGDSSQDMMLKLLFPLPSKPIKVGEHDDVPAQIPFNALGSVLPVKGRSRIMLERYVKIGKRTCAQLNVDTDLSELKVPSELKGDYACSAKGTSVFYFDVGERSFVSGTIAFIMQFSIDAPMPKMQIQGEKTSDLPKRSKMSMTNDNLIRVVLKE